MVDVLESLKHEIEAAQEAQELVVMKLQQQLLAEQVKLAQLKAGIAGLAGKVNPDQFRQDFVGKGIIEATEALLTENGNEPMTTVAIANALQARGLESKSKRITPTIYATLHNSKKFTRKNDAWMLRK